jgi:hypothetical protein
MITDTVTVMIAALTRRKSRQALARERTRARERTIRYQRSKLKRTEKRRRN